MVITPYMLAITIIIIIIFSHPLCAKHWDTLVVRIASIIELTV